MEESVSSSHTVEGRTSSARLLFFNRHVLLAFFREQIALPLGFSSCLKSAKTRINLITDRGPDQENEDVSTIAAKQSPKGSRAALEVDTKQQPARSSVVPLEGP